MRRARYFKVLVGVESVTPEGLKAVLQEFQRCRRSAGHAASGVSFRRVCTSWACSFSASRPTSRIPSRRRPSLAQPRRRLLRPVRDAHAISRDARFRQMGERGRLTRPAVDRLNPAHPLLAHSSIAAAESLRAPSDDDGRRNPYAHAGRVGRASIRCPSDLGALDVCQVHPRPSDVRDAIEGLWILTRTRASRPTAPASPVRPVARAGLPKPRAGCSWPNPCRTCRNRALGRTTGASASLSQSFRNSGRPNLARTEMMKRQFLCVGLLLLAAGQPNQAEDSARTFLATSFQVTGAEVDRINAGHVVVRTLGATDPA